MVDSSPRSTQSVWRPLRTPIFRNLLIADVVSDVGTFMQSVGAAWLMISLNTGPIFVALIQTASSLPFFIFALPAGTLGDIVDRRRLILYTETWMLAVAVAVARFVEPAVPGWSSTFWRVPRHQLRRRKYAFQQDSFRQPILERGSEQWFSTSRAVTYRRFFVLAEELNFTRAAHILRISQHASEHTDH